MARQICSFLKNRREVGKKRHRFKDSCNMNILNWNLHQKINSIRTWSLQKVEFLSEITLFLPLKFERTNYYFQFKDFYVPFMTLQGIGFKCFAKIITGSCIFCCSSCISTQRTTSMMIKFYCHYLIYKYNFTFSFFCMRHNLIKKIK